MSLKRTVYVPRFDSQLSHSQMDESISCSLVSLSQTPAPKVKRGDQQRARPAAKKTTGLVLTVKLPKYANKSLATKSKSTGPRWVLEPKVHQKKTTTLSQREESQRTGHGSDAIGEKDAYVFSKENQAKSNREKVKMAVLRNIARMLEENNQIRQRLVSLSQVNCSHTKP